MTTEPTITVCAECLKASCWQRVAECKKALFPVEKTRAELEKLGREHPDYWREK